MKPTAIEYLKTFSRNLPDTLLFAAALRAAIEDKGLDLGLVKNAASAELFGKLFAQWVLRYTQEGTSAFVRQLCDYALKSSPGSQANGVGQRFARYSGLPAQNRQIDMALARSNYHSNGADFQGTGVATNFGVKFPDALAAFDSKIARTPIVVLGGGVSGLMAAHALIHNGWNPSAITLVERQPKIGGIWSQDNVHGLSRNNPRKLQYLGLELGQAPGPGIEVRNFVSNLANSSTKILVDTAVVRVEPGDLRHKVTVSSNGVETLLEAPIVINALGHGKPRPLSDSTRMVTSATATLGGERWQSLLDANKAHRKRFLLVGLGNSTAEMLVQFERARRAGFEIDYRVLTHYPADAVHNPNDVVEKKGRAFRVFRDLSQPNLTDFSGDLPEVREAYFSALFNGKIVPGVTKWERKAGHAGFYRSVEPDDWYLSRSRYSDYKLAGSFAFDRLQTLLGYGQERASLRQLGCKVRKLEEERYCVRVDYDGEFQRATLSRSRDRLYPGYFGLGPIIETPENPNATVIPGNIFRMGDMFTLVMRALEHVRKA